MWECFHYSDTSDEIAREGWWEKYKNFWHYEWVFKDGHGSGACIRLSTRPLVWIEMQGFEESK